MSKIGLRTIPLVMILPALVLTASCNKKADQPQPVSTIEPEVQEAPAMSAEKTPAPAPEETTFVNENVHFAYDSAVLSEQERQNLKNTADYLRTNPDITMTVEGHCDERGSDAYNIALGERRAKSVKNFLVDLGVGSHRLKTVSYGEERPVAAGHNETSWAKNRRAQFAVH